MSRRGGPRSIALESPFGTFYGSNTTPDKGHGIGNWSADDFYEALHRGVAPDKHLYPAMPYTSYRGLTRADSDAMYAYLMQLKPAAVPDRIDFVAAVPRTGLGKPRRGLVRARMQRRQPPGADRLASEPPPETAS